MANKFTLTGHGIEVTYTRGATPSLPALTFKAVHSDAKTFTAEQVRSETTSLGQLITVSLVLTVDAGATTFSFFLPDLNVPEGEKVQFPTVGITREVRGPVVLPARQHVHWHSVQLHGTAENVIVPV